MIRLRRLPPSTVLRRPRYEVEFTPDTAQVPGWVKTTGTPATLIDSYVGVDVAWALTRQADSLWTGGVGPWVGDPEPDAGPSVAAPATPGINVGSRSFRLWEYQGARSGLLLRSPREGGNLRNVDLVFDDVDYVSVPRSLSGIELLRPNPDDLERVAVALGEVRPEHVFVLLSGGVRHLVVAASCRVVEHDGDPAASPFRPSALSRQWWAGRLGD